MPQSPEVCTARDFEALFPCAGTLGCVACLALQLFLLAYLHANVGYPSCRISHGKCSVCQLLPCLPGLPSCHVPSSPQLPISAPPTSLDDCFFFNSLVVRLPYSLIFSVVFLFLNLLLSFLLCEEAKRIYLCLYLGLKSFFNVIINPFIVW